MSQGTIDIRPKWGIELLSYLAGAYLVYLFGSLLYHRGIQLMEMGSWTGYASLLILILGLLGGLFVIIYYLSHWKYMDDQLIAKEDLFGKVRIPLSDVEEITVLYFGIQLRTGEQKINLDIFQKNYDEAMQRLKPLLSDNKVEIHGKSKHIRKHFGNGAEPTA